MFHEYFAGNATRAVLDRIRGGGHKVAVLFLPPGEEPTRVEIQCKAPDGSLRIVRGDFADYPAAFAQWEASHDAARELAGQLGVDLAEVDVGG